LTVLVPTLPVAPVITTFISSPYVEVWVGGEE
jgi:hypothetical protein